MIVRKPKPNSKEDEYKKTAEVNKITAKGSKEKPRSPKQRDRRENGTTQRGKGVCTTNRERRYCKYGSNCKFQHTHSNIICKRYKQGTCGFGRDCWFIHENKRELEGGKRSEADEDQEESKRKLVDEDFRLEDGKRREMVEYQEESERNIVDQDPRIEDRNGSETDEYTEERERNTEEEDFQEDQRPREKMKQD